MSLPSLSEIKNSQSSPESPLAAAFNILFEHSPFLTNKLEPQVHAIISSATSQDPAANSIELSSYAQLIELALSRLSTWNPESVAEFISGHPRIGENKNLSKLSASEQVGQNRPTPPGILARLAVLNELYEVKCPGLRYITFVNGRSRERIVDEMENVLRVVPYKEGDEPSVGVDLKNVEVVERYSEGWNKELERAVAEVGRIAKSRLSALGVH